MYKAIDDSRIELSELMLPSYSNFGGKVHGGTILSLMDKIAYACASRHAQQYCVTASVDTVDFLSPVEVGELVHMYASVNYVGNASMEIGIRTETHNIRTGETRHTNTSYFTMVAIGDDGKSFRVPGLILKSEIDVKRFLDGRARRQWKKQVREERLQLRGEFTKAQALEALSKERCQVEWAG